MYSLCLLQLNIHYGNDRTHATVEKKWRNLKSDIKSKARKILEQSNKTGAPGFDYTNISTVEKELAGLLDYEKKIAAEKIGYEAIMNVPGQFIHKS